jgi:hypothetical protein
MPLVPPVISTVRFLNSIGNTVPARALLLPLDISMHNSSRSGRRAVDPVLTLRREEIDVDRILGADEFMRCVRWYDQNHPSRHYKLLALRVDLASPFGNPRSLLVGVVVQREHPAFLHSPLYECGLRPVERLPLDER